MSIVQIFQGQLKVYQVFLLAGDCHHNGVMTQRLNQAHMEQETLCNRLYLRRLGASLRTAAGSWS